VTWSSCNKHTGSVLLFGGRRKKANNSSSGAAISVRAENLFEVQRTFCMNFSKYDRKPFMRQTYSLTIFLQLYRCYIMSSSTMCFVRHKEFYLHTQYHGSTISINVVKKYKSTSALIFWNLPKFLRNQNFLECACTPSSTTLGVAWLLVHSNECAAWTLTGNLFPSTGILCDFKSHCYP